MQSNTSMTYKEELIKNLEDKEYRKAFVESHINNSIAFQIRSMRGNLKQEDFGKNIVLKHQSAISRIENPNYGKFTLKTLKEIAAAFDVALMVRFVPFGDLIKWDLNLSSRSLDVPNFDKDPYLKEENKDSIANAASDKYIGLSNAQALTNVVDIREIRSNHIRPNIFLPQASNA